MCKKKGFLNIDVSVQVLLLAVALCGVVIQVSNSINSNFKDHEALQEKVNQFIGDSHEFRNALHEDMRLQREGRQNLELQMKEVTDLLVNRRLYEPK